MDRPNSATSIDTAIAAEALDLFDEQSLSNPKASKLVMGSSPRLRPFKDPKQSPTLRDSGTLPWRRASMDSIRQRSVTTPTRNRGASASQPKRPDSPDIDTYLKRTPRPRRSSSAVPSSVPSLRKTSRSSTSLRSKSKTDGSKATKDSALDSYGSLLEELGYSDSDNGGGSETDSSIDVNTPLPHLMFRDGVLSPRSKLLPKDLRASIPHVAGNAPDRSHSVLSIVSNAASVMTKSGLQKDPRDTERRRVRHRDGHLLRAGMGLTTGLGWSDSEDEDAPSALTRRLIRTTIDRKRSYSNSIQSSTISSRPNSEDFPSELSFSGLNTPVSTSKPPLARRAPQTDLRSKVGSHPLRSASVTFPSIASKLAKPKQSMDSLTSRDRTDSLSSYSQASFARSRAESMSSVATQGSHTRIRGDSIASREDPDALRTIMKTPTSTRPKLAELQRSPKSNPNLKATSSAQSRPITRSQSDSVTPQHLRADPNLLKLRSITKTGTVVPPGDVTPTPESPETPTTKAVPQAGPLGAIAHSKNSSVSSGAISPQAKVMASPAKRVEVISQTTHAEFDVHKVTVNQTLSSYTTPVISSLPMRNRTESSASATTASSQTTDSPSLDEMTHTASASTTSLASTAESSSASHGSSGSASSVPRPLRLPQKTMTRSFTQDFYMSSTSSTASITSTSTVNGGERYQRQRAVSGPRPYRPGVTSSAPSSPPATRTTTDIGLSQSPAASYTSPLASPTPTSATVSPSAFSPLSSPGSPRQRPPQVLGAREPRPKPRTGTGMAYRTSSFGNIQDPRMRNMMLSSAVLDRATATTSGSAQPIRI